MHWAINSDYAVINRLVSAWRRPLPVTNFFEILAVFGNILFVLDQLVVHLLNQMRAFVAKLRQMHNRVFYKVEAVDFVLYTHIERSGNRTFFQIAMYRQTAVMTVISQLMNQCRISDTDS